MSTELETALENCLCGASEGNLRALYFALEDLSWYKFRQERGVRDMYYRVGYLLSQKRKHKQTFLEKIQMKYAGVATLVWYTTKEPLPYLCCKLMGAVGERYRITRHPSPNRYIVRSENGSFHKVKASAFRRCTGEKNPVVSGDSVTCTPGS